jgi:hypothetical protein
VHRRDRRQVAFISRTDEHRRRAALDAHANGDLVERDRAKSQMLVKAGADLRKESGRDCAVCTFTVQQFANKPRRVSATALFWRREHRADARHDDVATVQPHVEAVPLCARQHLASVIEQSETLQMVATPRRPELCLVPLSVCDPAQPFIPDWIRDIEDALADFPGRDDNRHRTSHCTAANPPQSDVQDRL